MKRLWKWLRVFFDKKEKKMNQNKYEKLSSLFLRLNGYFLVDNFIVHAGDDTTKITQDGVISQHTEIDTLGVRMPYQKEISGDLHIINHEDLILDNDKIDFVIIESKSGKSNKPNRTWRSHDKINTIKYILKFFGIFRTEEEINVASEELLNNFSVSRNNFQFRFIVISEARNKHYSEKGIKYITYDSIIDFIVRIRGGCWIETEIGITSYHGQWDGFMKKIFELANNFDISEEERRQSIRRYLNE